MELYEDVTIPVPDNRDGGILPQLPPFIANEKNEGRNRWHWRFDTPEKYQTMMKNYYRLATEVDTTCGRVLAELKKQGVLDNTLVIFTTDNGYFHAEHGLADKWYPHQESIRVPLIVRDPRMPEAQARHDQRRLHAERRSRADHPRRRRDRRPAAHAGPRLRAALSRPPRRHAWRTEFFYEHATITNTSFIPSSEALVRRDWKYFYWPDFDASSSSTSPMPHEENDVVSKNENAAQLAEMKTRFAELKKAAK